MNLLIGAFSIPYKPTATSDQRGQARIRTSVLYVYLWKYVSYYEQALNVYLSHSILVPLLVVPFLGNINLRFSVCGRC
jgi:hypothetical protein